MYYKNFINTLQSILLDTTHSTHMNKIKQRRKENRREGKCKQYLILLASTCYILLLHISPLHRSRYSSRFLFYIVLLFTRITALLPFTIYHLPFTYGISNIHSFSFKILLLPLLLFYTHIFKRASIFSSFDLKRIIHIFFE